MLRRRGPASALAATGAGSLLFGILILMSVLLYRNYFYAPSAPAAEAHYTVLVTLAAVGYGCAALVIPPVTRRLTKPATIALLFAAGAVVTGVLGETFAQGGLPGHRVLPVPDPAGRGHLRDHDPPGGGGRCLPRPGVLLLRHDVQRHLRARRGGRRGLHAGHRPVTGDHRRGGGGLRGHGGRLLAAQPSLGCRPRGRAGPASPSPSAQRSSS